MRTNLTTRALAALFHTSQSTVDPIIHHLVPVLARTLRPATDNSNSGQPWIIDGTLIPVHDQSISAVSKNYRRSVNTQIIICAHHRRVIVAGPCWPGNRNDVVVARATVAQMLTGHHEILGDGGYRGINTITTPRRDHTGPIIRDDHYRVHRRIRARVEHVIARAKTGKYCANAAAAASASTTASRSSPDSGTSRPTNNYGSTLSGSPRSGANWVVARCDVEVLGPVAICLERPGRFRPDVPFPSRDGCVCFASPLASTY